MTDECIQVMGGMGFMKVSDQSTSCFHTNMGTTQFVLLPVWTFGIYGI